VSVFWTFSQNLSSIGRLLGGICGLIYTGGVRQCDLVVEIALGENREPGLLQRDDD